MALVDCGMQRGGKQWARKVHVRDKNGRIRFTHLWIESDTLISDTRPGYVPASWVRQMGWDVYPGWPR